jgi:hypothetical protein
VALPFNICVFCFDYYVPKFFVTHIPIGFVVVVVVVVPLVFLLFG